MKNELPFTQPAPAPSRREIRPAQLDFTLPAAPMTTGMSNRRTSRRQRPCSNERAAWWFDQMRRVVDEGRDVEVTGVW